MSVPSSDTKKNVRRRFSTLSRFVRCSVRQLHLNQYKLCCNRRLSSKCRVRRSFGRLRLDCGLHAYIRSMARLINSTTSFLSQAYDYYSWTLSLSDERTRGWLMVDSPVPTLLYTILYLGIVCVGPRVMRDRKPFKLTSILVPYNLVMAVLNLYIAFELFVGSTRLKYSYICQPIRHISHKEELRIANAVWWYYFSKLLEFSDTFFFILRKKDKQLTFLHVYHHSTMFSLWWIGIKWVPSGSTFLPAMVNSFIHVLMYSYYGLAALGPRIAPFLWWKKYLTILQLVQFTTALILGINGIRSGCDFPLWMQYALVIYMLSFIVLFGNFYAKAYVEKGKNAYGAICNGHAEPIASTSHKKWD